MTDLSSAFIELRRRWFNLALAEGPPARFEDDVERTTREAYNADLKRKYDAQTEAIIRGESKNVAPARAIDVK